MSVARTNGAVIIGVNPHLVEVEVHLSSGLPGMSVIGLPDAALNESRDRVRAAVINSGLKWPQGKITVGLSPASLPKRGPGLDVAIALGILAADDQLDQREIERLLVIGELGLEGQIRSVAGALSAALAMRRNQRKLSGTILCGLHDASILRVVPTLDVKGFSSLRALVARLRGEPEPDDEPFGEVEADSLGSVIECDEPPKDFKHVRGQQHAKLALEVAAAGGHHIALMGRAGVGKTLLAERFPGLLPDLDDDEALEVTSIHQLAGKASTPQGLIRRPPFAAPHHTASRAAMVGGGRDDRPTIGLASLAHRGVMFLDEAAEFQPGVLDALREPIESGVVTIARSAFYVANPAQFQLIMATNPCPCGNAMDTHRGAICRCTPNQRKRYLGRISGPLLDRIDVRIVLERPTIAALNDQVEPESTSDIALRVAQAASHLIKSAVELGLPQPQRGLKQVSSRVLLERWPLTAETRRQLELACSVDSLRGRDRTVRVAWTVAALAGRDRPNTADIEVATDLRAAGQQWAA